jgi:hypothetical protein
LWMGKVLDGKAVQNALVGLATTILIICAVELIPEAGLWIARWSRRGQFREFFGAAACEDEVRLVFAFRRLDPQLKAEPWHTHYCVPQAQGRPIPEGVNAWLAFQDVRAAAYLASTISEITGRQVCFIHDKDAEDDRRFYSAVSIGLGFNGLTHQLAGYFNPALFSIRWDKSPKEPHILTDILTIGDQMPAIPPGKDLALVARVVPRRETGRPVRVWFVCAGRTAAGTSAAGYYLAKNWEEMLDLYCQSGKDLTKDSVVVLVQHNEDKSSGSAAHEYEYDDTAELVRQDGRPVLNWGRVSGINGASSN